MIEPTDLDWLALCLVTESNRPAEWPYIAQVIENRRKTGRWGDTYRSVVLAPMQFSAFNPWTKRHSAENFPDLHVYAMVAANESTLLLMRAATFVAENSNPQDSFSLVISPTTLHYFSPVSMKPPGSQPPWAANASRLYTPRGADPERFVFAEGVP